MTGETGDQDEALIQSALAGDRRAMRTLALRVDRALAGRARAFRRLHGSHWAVDDMVASVWIELLRNGGRRLAQWRRDRGRTVESYVGMIATGRWLNQLAHEGTKKSGAGLQQIVADVPDTPSPSPSPESKAMTRELLAELWDHLVRVLPARELVVLRLVFSFGLTPTECARALNDAITNINNRLTRIRTEARAFLAGHS